jgi:hypothetical protein
MSHRLFTYYSKAGQPLIVIYTFSGIKAILQDSSVKIADDEFPVICFSPRVMYKILSKTAPN